MGRRATKMIAWFEGFDLIVESMCLTFKYTVLCFLWREWFLRCVWSELLNQGTIVLPSYCRSYWRTWNRRRWNKIQPTYLLIPPPVTWFKKYLSTSLNFMGGVYAIYSLNVWCCMRNSLVSKACKKRNMRNHCGDCFLDWANDCNKLCLWSNCCWQLCKTFGVTFWIKCGTKRSCCRLQS